MNSPTVSRDLWLSEVEERWRKARGLRLDWQLQPGPSGIESAALALDLKTEEGQDAWLFLAGIHGDVGFLLGEVRRLRALAKEQ